MPSKCVAYKLMIDIDRQYRYLLINSVLQLLKNFAQLCIFLLHFL